VAISKDKVRANLVIEKDIKKQLEDIAVKETRSFNSLVVSVLKKYLESEGNND